jgi:hypothetical protein
MINNYNTFYVLEIYSSGIKVKINVIYQSFFTMMINVFC